MCGFVGFVGGTDNQSEVLTKMMDRIVHRGPDMGGQFIDGRVALGFRRLSILDLTEAGAQPMANEDGSVVIVFNGEIYNFQELRSELEAKGYKFHCGADTESLLHGYEEWGEAVLDRLRGMYAFVIWDKKKNKLFGARDIFGIKPLYYYPMADAGDGAPGVLFGSEIKSFLDYPHFHKAVNKKALRPYMTLQYSATEETFFEGVYKLPPAHYFTVDIPTGKMNIERYWDCDYSAVEKPFEEYVDELDEVVHESVEAHRIADVKVASFLSGGVDSSYIAACLMPDKTFSVGFDYKNFNETNYAKELSDKLGVENVRKMITADEFFGALEDIQYHMDEPQSNLSSVPLWFLAEMARKDVTVVLSGEGADELFGGYAYYEDTVPVRKYKKMVPLPVRRALGNLALHAQARVQHRRWCLRACRSHLCAREGSARAGQEAVSGHEHVAPGRHSAQGRQDVHGTLTGAARALPGPQSHGVRRAHSRSLPHQRERQQAGKSGTTMSRSTSPRRGQASSSIPTSSCACSICTLRARAISSARSIRRSCS